MTLKYYWMDDIKARLDQPCRCIERREQVNDLHERKVEEFITSNTEFLKNIANFIPPKELDNLINQGVTKKMLVDVASNNLLSKIGKWVKLEIPANDYRFINLWSCESYLSQFAKKTVEKDTPDKIGKAWFRKNLESIRNILETANDKTYIKYIVTTICKNVVSNNIIYDYDETLASRFKHGCDPKCCHKSRIFDSMNAYLQHLRDSPCHGSSPSYAGRARGLRARASKPLV
jgi:hypothetical protein